MANRRRDPASAVRDAADGAAPWIEMLARIGYASRGVLYIVIGALAVALATGTGGETTDSRGALRTIAEQPLGTAMLIVIAIGMAGYAAWRFAQALSRSPQSSNDAKAAAKRIGYGLRGAIHLALAVAAVRIAMGSSSGGSSGETESRTAWVMQLPAGRWLVGLAGAGVIAYGLYRIVNAWKSDIGEKMRVAEMSRDTSRRIIHVSRFGIAARGVVFVIVGWFFVQAAVQYDSSEAGGVSQALDTLARQPYGPWLLGIIALGLVAFGIHSLLEAKYRRIDLA